MSFSDYFKRLTGAKNAPEKASPFERRSADDIERIRSVVYAKWETKEEGENRYLDADYAKAASFQLILMNLRVPYSVESQGDRYRTVLGENARERIHTLEEEWEQIRQEAMRRAMDIKFGSPVNVPVQDPKHPSGQKVAYSADVKAMGPDWKEVFPKVAAALNLGFQTPREGQKEGAYLIEAKDTLWIVQAQKDRKEALTPPSPRR